MMSLPSLLCPCLSCRLTVTPGPDDELHYPKSIVDTDLQRDYADPFISYSTLLGRTSDSLSPFAVLPQLGNNYDCLYEMFKRIADAEMPIDDLLNASFNPSLEIDVGSAFNELPVHNREGYRALW